MSDRRATLPHDEATATMIAAALGEAETIMVERGLNQDDVTSTFLTEGIDRLWTEEDREGLRTKVYAAVSSYVDALFDNVGDAAPREPSKYPEMDTPAFAAKAHALINKEERSFQDWLKTDDFDKLIDEAIKAGKDAFVTAPDDDTKPRTWAVIDLGSRRVKLLVMALQRRGIGELLASNLTYNIAPHEFTKVRERNPGPDTAAIEAFALKLSAPGFELAIWHDGKTAARAA